MRKAFGEQTHVSMHACVRACERMGVCVHVHFLENVSEQHPYFILISYTERVNAQTLFNQVLAPHLITVYQRPWKLDHPLRMPLQPSRISLKINSLGP